MTVLYLGSGQDSLSGTANVGDDGSGDAFVRTDTWVGNTSGDYAETPEEWSAVQELWVHFACVDQVTGDHFYLMDGATVILKYEATSTTTGRLMYLSAAATYTQLGTDFTIPSQRGYLDLYFKSGASGEVGVFVNQTEVMYASGLTMTYSPDVTRVRWVKPTNNSYQVIGGICVSTTTTIGGRVVQGYMTGNGASTAWTGDYTAVDEIQLNDADYIYTPTADQVETFTFTLKQPMTGYIPRAVAVAARARRGTTGPANIQLALRSGSTTYFSSSKALSLGYDAYVNVWNTNPDTSAAWTSSQIASLQPGVKSIT